MDAKRNGKAVVNRYIAYWLTIGRHAEKLFCNLCFFSVTNRKYRILSLYSTYSIIQGVLNRDCSVFNNLPPTSFPLLPFLSLSPPALSSRLLRPGSLVRLFLLLLGDPSRSVFSTRFKRFCSAPLLLGASMRLFWMCRFFSPGASFFSSSLLLFFSSPLCVFPLCSFRFSSLLLSPSLLRCAGVLFLGIFHPHLFCFSFSYCPYSGSYAL